MYPTKTRENKFHICIEAFLTPITLQITINLNIKFVLSRKLYISLQIGTNFIVNVSMKQR